MDGIRDVPISEFSKLVPLTGRRMQAAGESEDICVLRPFHGWVDLPMMFPIAAAGVTCREHFQFKLDNKYTGYYQPEFVQRCAAAPITQTDTLILGGVPNYWHFMVDHVARLPTALLGQHSSITVAPGLPPTFHNIARSVAQYLGLGSLPIVEAPGQLVRSNGATMPCVISLPWRLRFLRTFGASVQRHDGPERVFIWRGETAVRRLLNEADLARRLELSHGFVVLDPAEHTVHEQINAVANARIIVGGHGAGLTNAIFSPKLQSLVECFVTNRQPFFEDMCQALNIRHYCAEGEPATNSEKRADDAHYRIHPELLSHVVDEALAGAEHKGRGIVTVSVGSDLPPLRAP